VTCIQASQRRHLVDASCHSALLSISGEVDVVNAGELRSAALRTLCRDGHHLTLDLSAVTFIDLSGLASLLAVNRRAAALGGSLRLKDPSRSVTRLLELTRLTGEFETEPSN